MSPQFVLPLMETVKHLAPVQQRKVTAWLRPGESHGPASPGMLLNSDAVLIKAPGDLLARSSAGLEVVIETTDGLGSPLPVAEIKVIRAGSAVADGSTIAMLRLATPSDVEVPSTLDRAYWAELRQEDFWQAAARIGLVPAELDTLLPPLALRNIPPTTAVLPVISEPRMSWCDIFWWLC